MKKIWAVLLAAACLFSVFGGAAEEGFEPYDAVIANPLVADRLNVREKPDQDAASLGRFYSGTPVYVTAETQDQNGDAWAYIQIGLNVWDDAAVVRGYVRKEYLMRKNRNYGAPQWFVSAEPADGRVVIKAEPRNGAENAGTLASDVWVLGDVGDDWRYVMNKETYGHGYVRTGQLKNKTVHIPDAYLIPADGGECAAMYADQDLKRQIGSFYAGAPVRVRDCSRAGWAKVESYGTMYSRTSPGDPFVEGYVKLQDLTVFIQPWEAARRGRTGYALKEIPLSQEGPEIIPQGAAVTVAGEYGGKYQVCYSILGSALDFCALAEKESVWVSDQPGTVEGPAALGFACVPIPRDAEGYAEGFLQYAAPGAADPEQNGFSSVCQVLSDRAAGWLQVRQFPEPSFFIKREEAARVVRMDELYPAGGEKGPGAWTAEKGDAGLWLFTGTDAVLHLQKDGSGIPESYAITDKEKNVSYTVYIPAGTGVTMEGDGALTPFRRENAPILLDQNAADIREDQPLFSGTGQFFCDGQIQTCHNYYDFRLRPVPGAEDCYFRIGNLFESPQEAENGAMEEDGEYAYVSLLPGDLIEIHNYELYAYFGNG